MKKKIRMLQDEGIDFVGTNVADKKFLVEHVELQKLALRHAVKFFH